MGKEKGCRLGPDVEEHDWWFKNINWDSFQSPGSVARTSRENVEGSVGREGDRKVGRDVGECDWWFKSID